MKWVLLLMLVAGRAGWGQARDGMLTEGEVESLRDTSDVPVERVKAYEQILNDREKEISSLLAKRHGADFGADMHDVIDQFGSIADELNDNLDEYEAKKRDLRKVLPKLVEATDKWSTVLRTPVNDERYDVVRKSALDAVKDMHELAESIEAEQVAYFKEHPEAAAEEKQRAEHPNAPR